MIAGIAWADTPAINKAKSQAEALREQIDELDAQVEAAVEEYNTANAMLEETRAAAEENEERLAEVESDLEVVKAKLSDRLVQIYKEGHLGVIDTLVSSESLADLVSRLNLLERLSKQDAQLVDQVTAYQKEVTERKAELERQIVEQEEYKDQAAAAEEKVEAQLAAKEKALQGKEKLIAQLEKEEAERQAALAEAARKAAEEARKAREEAARTTTTKKVTTTTEKSTPTTDHTGTTSKNTTTTKKKTTTTEKETPTTDAPSSGGGTSGGDVVDYALQFLGAKYVWAGASPSGFDCSGFTMYVYRHFGISLPHSSKLQAGYGRAVSRSDLEPGDLVFFFSPIHHVGIYIGGGKMVNAAGTGKGVRIDYLWSSYNTARRILD